MARWIKVKTQYPSISVTYINEAFVRQIDVTADTGECRLEMSDNTRFVSLEPLEELLRS